MPHNTVGIPLNAKVAWVRDALDVVGQVLQQDGLPVRHLVEVFEVSRDSCASTLARLLAASAGRRGRVAFSANSMDVVHSKEILFRHGLREAAEDLINFIVRVTHRKIADLDDFEATVMHQQMSHCQNVPVLVFPPAIVHVKMEC